MKLDYVPTPLRKTKMATQHPKPILDEQWERIAEMLKYGGNLEDAAAFAGISYGRLYRNFAAEVHLRKKVKKIMAKCKLHHLKRVYEGVRGWQSSAWFLSRVYRREYGETVPGESTDEKAIRVRKVVRKMGPLPETPDDLSMN